MKRNRTRVRIIVEIDPEDVAVIAALRAGLPFPTSRAAIIRRALAIGLPALRAAGGAS